MKSIRLIHADDHWLPRYGIETLLAEHAPHIKVEMWVTSYPQLYAVLRYTKADVLLLDGVIDGGTIEDNLPKIRQLYPDMKILIFWMGANQKSWLKLCPWLDGQLTIGHADTVDIIQAIETVAEGGKFIPVYG